MRIAGHDGEPGRIQNRFHSGSPVLMAFTLETRCLEMTNGGSRGRTNRGWQRSRENEARRIAAHGIDKRRAARDVTAQAAECLRQCSFDNIEAPHDASLFGLAAAAGPVTPN